MSDLEQRLLRAARELRELDPAPPPLRGVTPSRRASSARIPALVMPALVVLGGLAVMAGTLGRDIDTDPMAEQVVVVASSAPVPAPTSAEAATEGSATVTPEPRPEQPIDPAAPAAQPVRALTAHEEVVMIGSLASSSRLTMAVEPVPVTSLRRF